MASVVDKLYMDIEQKWNDIYRGKTKYLQKNLTQNLTYSFEISELYKARKINKEA
jgi:hypothetical protein